MNVPSVVTVTEDMATGGQIWTRLYARRNGFPQIIHSSKRFSGPTGLEEYLGRGLSVALRVRVRGDAFVFCSDGRFEFRLEVSHPRFGLLISQSAVFREAGP